MDKLNQYQQIIKNLILEIAKLSKSSYEGIETQLIIDEQRGQYLLYSNGWYGGKRTYGSFLHIEIKENGIVCLHHDGTDLAIGEQLINQGIAPQDLIPTFQSPEKRKLLGFAV
ncbi:MAG: XisI protein [Microscillaceae bacterium]|jgi:hypothetical protein|nr:XisI protein [Microscillaceae bacterium]